MNAKFIYKCRRYGVASEHALESLTKILDRLATPGAPVPLQ